VDELLKKLNTHFPTDWYTNYTDEDNAMIKGWTKFKQAKRARENARIEEIGQLQYIKRNKIYPPHFRGKIKKGNVWVDCKTRIRFGWVRWAFHRTFVGMLVGNPTKWIPVPVGSANPESAPVALFTNV